MKLTCKNLILVSALALGIPASSISAEEQVYGYQLMTEQERIEHRTKMQSLKTMEERNRYRLEHHKLMEQRAREQGVTLPEAPLPRGMGGGPGMGGGGGGGR